MRSTARRPRDVRWSHVARAKSTPTSARARLPRARSSRASSDKSLLRVPFALILGCPTTASEKPSCSYNAERCCCSNTASSALCAVFGVTWLNGLPAEASIARNACVCSAVGAAVNRPHRALMDGSLGGASSAIAGRQPESLFQLALDEGRQTPDRGERSPVDLIVVHG